ncbi:BRO family protein, partial [Clostridioides difficile]|nr:BRO family protein [Clostridioides difficile]
QGSNKPQMYYKHFTELVRKKLGIPKGVKRDELNQSELFDIQALERIISMKLPKLIDKDMNYKEVYKKIKELIEMI